MPSTSTMARLADSLYKTESAEQNRPQGLTMFQTLALALIGRIAPSSPRTSGLRGVRGRYTFHRQGCVSRSKSGVTFLCSLSPCHAAGSYLLRDALMAPGRLRSVLTGRVRERVPRGDRYNNYNPSFPSSHSRVVSERHQGDALADSAGRL